MARKTHTFLVIASKPNRPEAIGKLSSVQPGEGLWGNKEIPPRFDRVSLICSPTEAQWILDNCKYDFDKTHFVTVRYGKELDIDYDIIESVSGYGPNVQDERDLYKLLSGVEDVEDPCDLLTAFHLIGDEPNQSYWYDTMYPYRKLSGVKKFIESVLYGTYHDNREAFRSLTTTVQNQIFVGLGPAHEKYMRWLMLANTKEEADEILTGS